MWELVWKSVQTAPIRCILQHDSRNYEIHIPWRLETESCTIYPLRLVFVTTPVFRADELPVILCATTSKTRFFTTANGTLVDQWSSGSGDNGVDQGFMCLWEQVRVGGLLSRLG